jgi:hypothetical protein
MAGYSEANLPYPNKKGRQKCTSAGRNIAKFYYALIFETLAAWGPFGP